MKDNNMVVSLAMLANVYGSLENENFVVNTARFIERVKAISGLTSDKEVEDAISHLVKDKIEDGDSFSSKSLIDKWKDQVSAAVSDWLGEEGEKFKNLEFVGEFFNDKADQRKYAFKYIFAIYEREEESKRAIHTFFRLNYDEYGRLNLDLREEKKHVVIVSILESFFTAINIRNERNNVDLEICINRFHEYCYKDIIGYPYSRRRCNGLIQMVHEARQAKNQYHPPKVLPSDIFKKMVKALFVLSVLQRERQNSSDMKKSVKKALMLWYNNHKDQFSVDEDFINAYWKEEIFVYKNVSSLVETILSVNQTNWLWSVLKDIDNQGNIHPSADDNDSIVRARSIMESSLQTVIRKSGVYVESNKTFDGCLSLLEKMADHIWNIKKSEAFDIIEKSYSVSNDASCQYEKLISEHLPKFVLLLATIVQALEMDRYKTGIVFFRKPLTNQRAKIVVRDKVTEKDYNVREKMPLYISINTSKWKALQKTDELREISVAIGDKRISEKIKVKIDSWTVVGLGCENGKKPSVTIFEDAKFPGLNFDDKGEFIGSEPEVKVQEPEPIENTEEAGISNDAPDNKQEQKNEEAIEIQQPTPKVDNVEFRYDGSLMTMSCATRKVDIYYTLDGTVPTTSSIWYLSPFMIKPKLWPFWPRQKKIVKAIAIKDGYVNSDVATTIVPLKYPISLWLILLAIVVIFALALA